MTKKEMYRLVNVGFATWIEEGKAILTKKIISDGRQIGGAIIRLLPDLEPKLPVV